MGFPRLKNTAVGCHFLLQGDLPDSGIEPASPHWQILYRQAGHLGSPEFNSRYKNTTVENAASTLLPGPFPLPMPRLP